MDIVTMEINDSGFDTTVSSFSYNDSTPLSRKRKIFSSTLNSPSLVLNGLAHLDLASGYKNCDNNDETTVFLSAPSSPILEHCEPKRPLLDVSPIKEAQQILYGDLKPMVTRKPSLKPIIGTRRLARVNPLTLVISNDVIMNVLLPYLSNGDLYRLASVSYGFRRAVMHNTCAYQRYQHYHSICTVNKENYVSTTPPHSPIVAEHIVQTNDKDSQIFYEVICMVKSLKSTQTLFKCPHCCKPTIVENHLGQCQNRQCGYIYCQLCQSYSLHGPEHFRDACRNSTLLLQRSSLDDTTNRKLSISPILYPTVNCTNCQDDDYSSSGFCSGSLDDVTHVMTTTSSPNVKRQLFNNSNGATVKDKTQSVTASTVLRVKNGYQTNGTTINNSRTYRRDSGKLQTSARKKLTVMPVYKGDGHQKQHIDGSPSPPPKNCAAGSKQSKRNLKRLTR